MKFYIIKIAIGFKYIKLNSDIITRLIKLNIYNI